MSNTLVPVFTSVLIGLLPYWNANIIKYYKLGNEYSMGLTLILTELIKYFGAYINDISLLVSIVALAAGYFIILQSNYHSIFAQFKKKQITFIGTYMISTNNIVINYDTKLILFNKALIEKYHIKNVMIFPDKFDFIQIIDEVSNLQLDDDLVLTANRTGDTTTIMTYTLSSYKKNLIKFVDNLVDEYTRRHSEVSVSLYGIEQHNEYKYPDVILSIIQYMVEVHKYKDIKYFINVQSGGTTSEDKTTSNTKQYDTMSDKPAISTSNSDRNSDFKMIDFTLNDIKEYAIEPNIKLSICRQGFNVIFKLSTSEHTLNLNEYLLKLQTLYTKYIPKKRVQFKNSVQLKISCETAYRENFTTIGLAINYTLVNKYGLNKYKLLDLTTSDIWATTNAKADIKKYYIIDPINQYNIKDDIYITICKISNMPITNTVCVIESDYSNIDNFIDDCIKYYEQMENKDTVTTYHFVYNGRTDAGENKFITNILNTYETTDEVGAMSICNEHTASIKRSMDKLADINYYKKNGLKRKLGYLFYGQPGTGKTVMVSEMARYGRRHILEIPFSIIKSRDELLNLMNVTKINNISFKKDEIIILFDEIDIGIQHISREGNTYNETTNAPLIDMGDLCGACDKSIPKEASNSKLQLDVILSQLDGISNYDGLIIIATTNNKEKLDPALYRELRLTPIEFLYLRREDVRHIIERFWNCSLPEKKGAAIADRVYSPSKLVYLCDKFLEEKTADQFVDYLATLNVKK